MYCWLKVEVMFRFGWGRAMIGYPWWRLTSWEFSCLSLRTPLRSLWMFKFWAWCMMFATLVAGFPCGFFWIASGKTWAGTWAYWRWGGKLICISSLNFYLGDLAGNWSPPVTTTGEGIISIGCAGGSWAFFFFLPAIIYFNSSLYCCLKMPALSFLLEIR